MQIAICFSGLVRTYRDTYENFIKSIIEPNQHHHLDIFISTWPTEHSNNSMEWTRRQIWYKEEAKPFPEETINYQDLKNKYNPTLILIEKPIIFETESWYTPTAGTNIQSLRSMTYKILSADKLRRQHEENHNITYDAIIRIRFDTLVPFPIEIDKLDLNTLYVPSMMQPQMYPDKEWVNDKFAIGNRNIMTTYCEWHNNFIPLIQRGEPIQPETLLGIHLRENNIKYNPWGCEMELLRIN